MATNTLSSGPPASDRGDASEEKGKGPWSGRDLEYPPGRSTEISGAAGALPHGPPAAAVRRNASEATALHAVHSSLAVYRMQAAYRIYMDQDMTLVPGSSHIQYTIRHCTAERCVGNHEKVPVVRVTSRKRMP